MVRVSVEAGVGYYRPKLCCNTEIIHKINLYNSFMSLKLGCNDIAYCFEITVLHKFTIINNLGKLFIRTLSTIKITVDSCINEN